MKQALIEKIMKTFYRLSKINISYFNKEDKTFTSFIDLKAGEKRRLLDQLEVYKEDGLFRFSDNTINHYFIRVKDYDVFLAGPYLESLPHINDLKKYHHDNTDIKLLNNYYKSLQVLGNGKVDDYQTLLNLLVKASDKDFIRSSGLDFDHVTNENTQSFYKWQKNLNVKAIKHNQIFYENFFKCKDENELNSVMHKYYFISEPFEYLFDDKDIPKLRLMKNLLLNSTAFTFNEAIRRNTDLEYATNLLIHYNKVVESCEDVDELMSIRTHMLKAFFNAYKRSQLSNESPLVLHIKAYIDKHINEAIYVSDIAKSLDYNKDYLSHHFKQTTGISIMTYINKKKVDIAEHLLLHTSNKIYDISDYLGYNTISNFVRTFKKYKEVTPSELRKRSSLF